MAVISLDILNIIGNVIHEEEAFFNGSLFMDLSRFISFSENIK